MHHYHYNCLKECGEWRSLVARLLWEQEVAGSNPVSPTRVGDHALANKSAYLSLYRRWRPLLFSEVIGQEEIVTTLKNAVNANEVAHAYLFAGDRGIGKTSIARILAKAINCSESKNGEPCNACGNCKTISHRQSLDILEIDAASNRGIDHIRQLREEVNFSPSDLDTKVYIIDEVHMLTNEAFNALLKTLEEPPLHAMFVLATTEQHKVPRTIISRCQAFTFRHIPIPQISEHLNDIAKREDISIVPDAIDFVATRAEGAMRDAIVMLEQATTYGRAKITVDSLKDMLGVVSSEILSNFVTAIESGDHQAILTIINNLQEQGKDIELFLVDLIGFIRHQIAVEEGNMPWLVTACDGLLRLKQRLYRSLDQRSLLEIGALSLITNLASPSSGARTEELAGSTARTTQKADTPNPPSEKTEPTQHDTSDLPSNDNQTTEQNNEPTTYPDNAHERKSKELPKWWLKILQEIEQERIAMAAFLAEATPNLHNDALAICFHPRHSFQKESLEKPANVHYIAGVVHRHLGDNITVNMDYDSTVDQQPTQSQSLHEKAETVRKTFDGRILKEDL